VSLHLEELSFSYGSEPVLNKIDLQLNSSVTALVGPNAAGKTTLLRCITGTLKPSGRILLDGKDVKQLGRKARSRMIGYLAQEAPSRTGLTVMEAVLLGRLHTLSWRVSDEDLDMVYALLEELDMADLATRSINELSGGQRQMVSVAQVLVQQPRVLLMDEPTNNLDLHHQLEMLALIREKTSAGGLTTVIALHDLNLAAQFAGEVAVLDKGQIYAFGAPAAVLTMETLRAVYGVHARVSLDSGGLPTITPLNSVNAKVK
jgi:iron complex transport system ATP-binding protein